MTVVRKGSASLESQRIATMLRRRVYPVLESAGMRGEFDGRRARRLAALLVPFGAMARAPRGTKVRRIDFGAFTGEITQLVSRTATYDRPDDRIILFFHGGGFLIGSVRSHRPITARLSRRSGGIPVLSISYRHLPDHAISQSVADGVAAYDVLLRSGYEPDRVVFAGDSAGGNLAISVAVAARKTGMAMPAVIAAMSPWADLDAEIHGGSPNLEAEAYLPAEAIAKILEFHAEKFGPLDPDYSPVEADLAGLPPTIIQVGSSEILLHDAELLHERMAAAGVDVHLQIWDKQFHVFQAMYDFIPEAREATADMGEFIALHCPERRTRTLRRIPDPAEWRKMVASRREKQPFCATRRSKTRHSLRGTARTGLPPAKTSTPASAPWCQRPTRSR